VRGENLSDVLGGRGGLLSNHGRRGSLVDKNVSTIFFELGLTPRATCLLWVSARRPDAARGQHLEPIPHGETRAKAKRFSPRFFEARRCSGQFHLLAGGERGSVGARARAGAPRRGELALPTLATNTSRPARIQRRSALPSAIPRARWSRRRGSSTEPRLRVLNDVRPFHHR
jgi:hypothetical protein